MGRGARQFARSTERPLSSALRELWIRSTDVIDGSGASSKTQRPALPPVAILALSLWAGCAACYAAGLSYPREIIVPAAVAALSLAAVGCILYLRQFRQMASLALIGCAIGCAIGLAATQWYCVQADRAAASPSQEWVFVAKEDARSGSYKSTVLAEARSQATSETHIVNVSLPKGVNDVFYGEAFTSRASLEKPREATAQRLYLQGVDATAAPSEIEHIDSSSIGGAIAQARMRIIELLSGSADEYALCQALVCGYREQLRESDLYSACKAAGVAHLVAVSGAHLSITCAMIATALQALRAPRKLSLGMQLVFLGCYLVLTGMPISAVRAAVMATVGMTAFLAQRRKASLSALCICIIVIVAASPESSVSVSFFLSAASTLGIIALAPLFTSWLESVPFVRLAAEPLSLTLAATVATTPFSAALFSQLPLVAPFANMAVAPLFTIALVVSLIASVSALLAPVVTPLAMAAAYGAALPLTAVIEVFSHLPFACIPVSLPTSVGLALSIAGTTVLWLWWPRLRVRALAAITGGSLALALAVVVVIPLTRPAELVMLDVGQGDAFLVRSKGASVLIDTGNHDTQLLEALARHGVFRLDAVIVSHADDDHCGSLKALKGVVGVDRVLVSQGTLTCGCASCGALVADASSLVSPDGVLGVSVGDVIICGNFSMRAIWPHEFHDEGGNSDSLCLLATTSADAGGWTAFLCGDAEANQLQKMIDEGALGDIDVYKVGHHGSRAALAPAIAEKIDPEISLVSVGANNRYGHPTPETLSTLDAQGSQIFRTDEMGDVSCEFTRDSIRVITLR